MCLARMALSLPSIPPDTAVFNRSIQVFYFLAGFQSEGNTKKQVVTLLSWFLNEKQSINNTEYC